jgi:CRISPR-associated protein Csb2
MCEYFGGGRRRMALCHHECFLTRLKGIDSRQIDTTLLHASRKPTSTMLLSKPMPDTFSAHSQSTMYTPKTRGGGAILGIFGNWRPQSFLALPLAERVRAALMRASDGQVPWQISGKGDQGRPRRGHDHLYVLPFASVQTPGHEPRLNRVLLWADGGLEDATLNVIERLGHQGGSLQLSGRSPLRLELLGVGARETLAVPMPITGPARTWYSATSFVSPRFPKHRRGRDLDPPREQLSRLVTEVLGHTLERMTPFEQPSGRWSTFSQSRLKHPGGPRRPASGWVLRFSEPVCGPIVLGYGAHFGLGRFEADLGQCDKLR